MSKVDIVGALVVFLSGTVGALIGTFLGARFLHEERYGSVRKIAIKALNIFREYSAKRKSYQEAASEFNNKLKVQE